MENAKDVLRAIVILPELLAIMADEYDLPRQHAKYLLTMWVLGQTRYHVSKKEMLEVSTSLNNEISNVLIERRILRQVKDMPVQEGQAPAYYELTGEGQRLINIIEEKARLVIAKHSHLEELNYIR